MMGVPCLSLNDLCGDHVMIKPHFTILNYFQNLLLVFDQGKTLLGVALLALDGKIGFYPKLVIRF